MSSNEEATIQEVLEAINDYSIHNDKQLAEIRVEIGGVKADVGTLKTDVGTLKTDVGTLKTDVGGLKADISSIRAQMVTKSYLDDKLADLRGDLVVLTRKEDTKLKALVQILAEKKVLSVDETKRIFSMEPFPQLAL